MVFSNTLFTRKLEIMRKMDFYEEQMCIHPDMRSEAQRNITLLEDELENLEWEYRQQTSTPCRY